MAGEHEARAAAAESRMQELVAYGESLSKEIAELRHETMHVFHDDGPLGLGFKNSRTTGPHTVTTVADGLAKADGLIHKGMVLKALEGPGLGDRVDISAMSCSEMLSHVKTAGRPLTMFFSTPALLLAERVSDLQTEVSTHSAAHAAALAEKDAQRDEEVQDAVAFMEDDVTALREELDSEKEVSGALRQRLAELEEKVREFQQDGLAAAATVEALLVEKEQQQQPQQQQQQQQGGGSHSGEVVEEGIPGAAATAAPFK